MAVWVAHLKGGPKKVNHSSAVVGDKIYLVGGYCTGIDFRHFSPCDLYVLDSLTLRWQKIAYKLPSGTQWKPLTSHSEYMRVFGRQVPFLRYGHTVVSYNEKLYLWGGRNDKRACDDLYVFDTKSQTWSKPECTGYVPPRRDGHAACVSGNKMFIFGGFEEQAQVFSRDLFCLDLDTYHWSFCKTIGNPPSYRDFATITAIDDNLYVFGGRSDRSGLHHTSTDYYSDEVKVINLSKMAWSQAASLGDAPSGRRSHSAFVYEGCLYIFGGYNNIKEEHYNDLRRFDPKTETWTIIRPNIRMGLWGPCIRRRSQCQVVGDRLFLFGGTTPIDEEERLIDSDSEEEEEEASQNQNSGPDASAQFNPLLEMQAQAAGGVNIGAHLHPASAAGAAEVQESAEGALGNDVWEGPPAGGVAEFLPFPFLQGGNELWQNLVQPQPLELRFRLKDLNDLCVLDFKPSLKTLCILRLIKMKIPLKAISESLPSILLSEMKYMTQPNRIRVHGLPIPIHTFRNYPWSLFQSIVWPNGQ